MLYERAARTPSRVYDGTAVVVSPDSSQFHTFNPVATRVWELLASPRTVVDLVELILGEFDVDRETAVVDVEGFLEELVEKGLAERR